MQLITPEFDDHTALYIIWCESPGGYRTSLAAGCFDAMKAAWEALQDHDPRDELRLQLGIRIIKQRPARINERR